MHFSVRGSMLRTFLILSQEVNFAYTYEKVCVEFIKEMFYVKKRNLIIFICLVVVWGIIIMAGQQDEQTANIDNSNTSVTSNVESENAPEQSAEPVKSTKKWKAGQYKCGADIEPGIYMVFATGGSGYYSITTDANGDDIIANDNFDNNQILEISEGQYLKLSRAYAVKYDEAPTLAPENGTLPEGRYKVGQHIPAGEYKVKATSSVSAYYSLTSDPNEEDIISNDNFDGERYITIQDGQYLKLTRCQLIVQ